MSSKSRNVWVGILVVAGVAAVLALMRTPSGTPQATADISEPAPAAQPEPAPKPEPPSAPPSTGKPEAPAPVAAVDLFAGEMPDIMARAHGRVLGKQFLDVVDQRHLYDYGKAHKNDARPQLLLAWDSMNREWDGIAVRMYRIAYRADPRAKDDPSMLRDLLDVASRFDRTEFREATAVIKEAYGQAALTPVEEKLAALEAAGNSRGIERMEKLRAALTSPTP